MSFTDIVIFALIVVVVFLIWERFHYRRRISSLYDATTELSAGLESRFELRSHPALRHMFTLDAIIDDTAAKLQAVADWKSRAMRDSGDASIAEIRHFVMIEATPESVFRALTEQDGLAGWWTTQTKATPELGSVIHFDFGERYHNEMQVTRLESSHVVEWTCLVGDPEWVGTSFLFELEDRGDETALSFCHGKWREATDFLRSCNAHWGFYMLSLKRYCETGQGDPADMKPG